MAETILIKKEGKIATITLNRPEDLNGLTTAMVRRLEDELAAIRDDPHIRAVLITGSGKAFCAGVDMKERSYNPLNARDFLIGFNRMLKGIETLPQPSLAVINGAAVSGGLELALACTFRVAADDARLGLPEVKLGLVTAGGTTYRLPRLVGFGKAMEMCLMGELISGREAAACGLVNRAIPRADLDEETLFMAQRLADGPPIAMSLVKDALYAATTPQMDNAALMEILSASVNHYTVDKKKGLEAFFAKKKPEFEGR